MAGKTNQRNLTYTSFLMTKKLLEFEECLNKHQTRSFAGLKKKEKKRKNRGLVRVYRRETVAGLKVVRQIGKGLVLDDEQINNYSGTFSELIYRCRGSGNGAYRSRKKSQLLGDKFVTRSAVYVASSFSMHHYEW